MIHFKYNYPLDTLQIRNQIPLNLLKDNNFIVLDSDTEEILCYGTYKFKKDGLYKINIELSDSTFKTLILESLNREISLNIRDGVIDYYAFIPYLSSDLIKIRDLNSNLLEYDRYHKYTFYVLEESVKQIEGFMNLNPLIGADKTKVYYSNPKNTIITSAGYIYLGVDSSCDYPILIKETDENNNLKGFYFY